MDYIRLHNDVYYIKWNPLCMLSTMAAGNDETLNSKRIELQLGNESKQVWSLKTQRESRSYTEKLILLEKLCAAKNTPEKVCSYCSLNYELLIFKHISAVLLILYSVMNIDQRGCLE